MQCKMLGISYMPYISNVQSNLQAIQIINSVKERAKMWSHSKLNEISGKKDRSVIWLPQGRTRDVGIDKILKRSDATFSVTLISIKMGYFYIQRFRRHALATGSISSNMHLLWNRIPSGLLLMPGIWDQWAQNRKQSFGISYLQMTSFLVNNQSPPPNDINYCFNNLRMRWGKAVDLLLLITVITVCYC